MNLKEFAVRIGIKRPKQNRNRHDNELFISIWNSSKDLDEVVERYSRFTPVTKYQARQLRQFLRYRGMDSVELSPLKSRKGQK